MRGAEEALGAEGFGGVDVRDGGCGHGARVVEVGEGNAGAVDLADLHGDVHVGGMGVWAGHPQRGFGVAGEFGGVGEGEGEVLFWGGVVVSMVVLKSVYMRMWGLRTMTELRMLPA